MNVKMLFPRSSRPFRTKSKTNLFFSSLSYVVLNEIYERADWLAEMESLGEGKKHREVIQSQIADRLRMIKKLEVEREKSTSTLSTPSCSQENVRSK